MTIPIGQAECSVPTSVLAETLLNKSGKESLPARFRALFTLRGKDSDEAVSIIGQAFNDRSALLKHELAYVLGQMRRESAIGILTTVLCDLDEDSMVRHEAAEALGAIGKMESAEVLRRFLEDPEVAVRETCEIALDLLSNNRERSEDGIVHPGSGQLCFDSVDPAPALKSEKSVKELQAQLMDTKIDLYNRYKAMFALRNQGASEEAVLALCTGFSDSSALFRHEIAYVLGQLQHPSSVPALSKQLKDWSEVGMVRHECAEALGSIATPDCLAILREFEDDPEEVVRESCVVARDMYEYENSPDLHLYQVK